MRLLKLKFDPSWSKLRPIVRSLPTFFLITYCMRWRLLWIKLFGIVERVLRTSSFTIAESRKQSDGTNIKRYPVWYSTDSISITLVWFDILTNTMTNIMKSAFSRVTIRKLSFDSLFRLLFQHHSRSSIPRTENTPSLLPSCRRYQPKLTQ